MTTPRINILDVLSSVGSSKIKIIKLIDILFGSVLSRLVKSREGAFNLPSQINSILIIRPGGIGDAVFLLPILRKLKNIFPKKQISILCERRNAQIFSSQKGLCYKIYRYDTSKELFSLFKNKHDLIIDTEQWHYFSALIGRFLKPTYFIGFATRPNRSKLYDNSVNYKINAHELVNFSKLFDPIFLQNSADTTIENCYQITPEHNQWAQDKIPPNSITLFIGASIPIRRLDQNQCLAIIKYIVNHNYHVILIGGTDVIQAGKEVVETVADKRLLNFVGKISLEKSTALIKRSKLFIGPDSGLMHLACAVGTPVISIFGPGNLQKWRPIGQQHTIITENVDCSPCTLFGYTIPTCQKSYKCMRNIKMEKITSAIERVIHETTDN